MPDLALLHYPKAWLSSEPNPGGERGLDLSKCTIGQLAAWRARRYPTCNTVPDGDELDAAHQHLDAWMNDAQ